MKIKRSAWKFPFTFNSSFYFKKEKRKTYSRSLTLTTSFLDKKLECYRGLNVGKLLITKRHLGHKLGEFFLTKVLGERIAYRKRLKLLLKKRKNKSNLEKKKK
jgi:ribosomal protein S19